MKLLEFHDKEKHLNASPGVMVEGVSVVLIFGRADALLYGATSQIDRTVCGQ